jgi:hypothetical protein
VTSKIANFEAVFNGDLLSLTLFDMRPTHVPQMFYQTFVKLLFVMPWGSFLIFVIVEHKWKHLISISVLGHNLNILLTLDLVQTLSCLLRELKFSTSLVSFMLIY